jgi:hypothetical protein
MSDSNGATAQKFAFNIALKLPIMIVVAALVSGIAIGATVFMLGKNGINHGVEIKMSALSHARKVAIERYMDDIALDLHFMA